MNIKLYSKLSLSLMGIAVAGFCIGLYVFNVSIANADVNPELTNNSNVLAIASPATPIPLSVYCSALPNPANVNQAVTFTAFASGGQIGSAYVYNWSGACHNLIETSQTCSATFTQAGYYVATITVISGSQVRSANCPVTVNQTIISHDHRACFNNDVYWYDSNNNKNDLFQDCTSYQICQNAQCVNIACSTNSDCGNNGYVGSLFCQGNGIYQNYITYTCNNPGTVQSSCSNSTTAQLQTTCGSNQTCSNGSCTTNACSYHAYQRCRGGDLYWYDSCGREENYIGRCNAGGGSCDYHSYQRCRGGDLYWYDSCGREEDYIGRCNTGVSCIYHSYQRCNGSYLYWFDSCGTQQDIFQYCPNGCSNNSCTNNYGTLAVSKTVRNLSNGTGFFNSTYASPSDVVLFMITLQATGNQGVQNVSVRDTLPANLIYNNQLVIAGSSNYSGDIVSGINLNTIPAGQTVTITYQARVAAAANFAFGTTTLTNNVSVTSSASGTAPASNASVVVTRATVAGASTVATGLTNNFWVDSFFLPLMLTLIGLWMWKSGVFFGVEKWFDNKKKARMSYKSEKELSARIADIQKSAKI